MKATFPTLCCLFAILLISSFLPNRVILAAEPLDIQQKKRVLRSLLLEKNGNYKAAIQSWERIKEKESPRKQLHVYLNLLYLNQRPIPETNDDLYYGLRQALWRKDIKELNYLQKQPFIDIKRDDIRIQIATAKLFNFDYQQALLHLGGQDPKKSENLQEVLALKLAVFIMSEKTAHATPVLKQLKQESLYLYPGSIAPLIPTEESKVWERAAMHYQSDRYVSEQLFFTYQRQGKTDWENWKISKKEEWWKGYPYLALEHIKVEQAMEFLATKSSSPADFDRWMQYLEQKGQKKPLKQLCSLWQKRNPLLEDGLLCMQLVAGL